VPDLAVHLGGYHRSFDEALALVLRAEALGYRAAYVDGDVSVVPSRGDAPVLEGWTATVAILARTARIEVGSIRIARQWNAARLAQAVATAEVIAPGRLRFVSIGAQPTDCCFGFLMPPPGERIAGSTSCSARVTPLVGRVGHAAAASQARRGHRAPRPAAVACRSIGGAGSRLLAGRPPRRSLT
jgi:hypothetical protein